MQEAQIETTAEGKVAAGGTGAADAPVGLSALPGTAHITVGAGDEPCAILMFGSPDPRRTVEWIANETAAKHGASVAKTTGRATKA